MNRIISWMAQNGVAANLLMVFILFTGIVSALVIPQKVFPEFSLDTIQVRVEYPGASPREIETAMIQRVEERVEGIEGIRQITATAAENVGFVTLELQLGTNTNQKLDEIKAEIDRITAFPAEAEEPEVTELTNRLRVLEVVLYGEASERALKELAYRVEDELSARGDISFVQVSGIRDYEISIEVSKDALRAYDLTLPEIARRVQQNSLDLPGGDIQTSQEEILLRVEGQNYDWRDYRDIILIGRQDGAQVRLGQVAQVEDAFREAELYTRYNGQPAAVVEVFRTGDEKVLDIVSGVQEYLDTDLRPTLPPGIKVGIWRNEAEQLRSRLRLLLKNGLLGLALVILALTLFLNLRLAFWVSVGIFISFIGTFAVMSYLGVSINQLSLFGFILAIGIVVDDAIVVGENIYAERERGAGPLQAAIRGAQRVAVPVIFAVSTTIAAFVPLLFVPGVAGKIMNDIPTVVISVLVLSLVESLLILPHHLSSLKEDGKQPGNRVTRLFERMQGWVDDRLQRFKDGPLDRALHFATAHSVVVLAGATALMLLSAALLVNGYIKFNFLPQIEGEYVTAQLEMAEGTTAEVTRDAAVYLRRQGEAAAHALEDSLGQEGDSLIRNVFVTVGRLPQEGGPDASGPEFTRSNVAAVVFQMRDASERRISSRSFEQAWRSAVASLPGARKLTFSSSAIDLGAPVQLELSAASDEELERAVMQVREALRQYGGVFDVRDDLTAGKRELELALQPQARSFGVTLDELARQVRAAFFGAEALRVQRGREEVRVYVRLPEEERDALDDLTDYRIRNRTGGAIPLGEVARVSYGYGPSTINRRDGRRIATVTADVDPGVTSGQEVTGRLRSGVLPELEQEVQGLRYSFGGEQREQRRALSSLARNFVIALFAIYALLAIPFRSYLQPVVIMAAIPLGLIGAVLGHLIMGLSLGLLSLFGIIGLSGVVVNDSLVMIDFINERRLRGMAMRKAIIDGAKSRFRPILLTSITTFLGIAPLIFEQSLQAQFLIPLAVSLGFGILVATAILMLVVPALTQLHYNAEVYFQRRILRRDEEDIVVVRGSHGRQEESD